MNDGMEEIRQTFFVECRELLEAAESGLLAIQRGEHDLEIVNAVFRAVHSIKGGAGAFGYDMLVRFAHTFESLLDDLRSQRLEADRPLVSLLLRCSDLLSELVDASEAGTEISEAASEKLISEIKTYSGSANASADDSDFEFDVVPLDIGFDIPASEPTPPKFNIAFAPKENLLRNGGEPVLLMRELASLGPCTVTADTSALPALEDLDPLRSYIHWNIEVEAADQGAVREVFDFVEPDCELKISVAEVFETFGGLLSSLESVPIEIAAAPSRIAQYAEIYDDKQTGAVPEKSAPAQAKTANHPTIRVDLDRVDRLINLVGELVVNQAMLSQAIQDSGLPVGSTTAKGLDEFKQLVREVQDSVLAIRAQPVRSLFQRMTRVVREAAAATGKDVSLEFEGEAAEIDKTVLEHLSDPLTHMLRNAVDHGLETPEERLAAGKSEQGVIKLVAEHRSGRVIIEVSDDGAGINRERVRAKAIEKGLIAADAVLSPSEIDNILFLPGFSTAAKVSDLSGRGVGMDVVKRAIQGLGGKISIRSAPGKGTTFSISLPLTLALLDGMLVQVAQSTMVIPITSISETIKPQASNVHLLGNDGPVVLVRGEFIPVVDVSAVLGLRRPLNNFDNQVFVLVELEAAGLRAFAVDDILDQRQVVIKSLEQNYQRVDGVAAATILGDGRIALILDPEALGTTKSVHKRLSNHLSPFSELKDDTRKAV
jgi:two-component system chemotaxis sensor kinase CheA